MISKQGDNFDIILITGEVYDDHPLSPAGVIAKVLEAKGFSVGIIESPKTLEDFKRFGTPKLCFCITSGSIDSMLNNYTPLKKDRQFDDYSRVNILPDRAVIVYCNKIKEFDKKTKIVIGGVEASLRRFCHYDYWDNNLRRSILLDSRADILVYGNGERQIIEIAEKLKNNESIVGIKGTCVLSKTLPEDFELLPSYKEATEQIKKFCQMHVQFSNYKNLAQKYDNNYVLQFIYPEYTTEELDWIYSLPFSRNISRNSLLEMAQFSVVTHRGCFGNCNFCSIALHQGTKIVSRSEKNILEEIKSITKHPDFKGYIDDLGGPSANMYEMSCKINCDKRKNCVSCCSLDKTHQKLLHLLREARKIEGVKKIFVRSGIRYDLAMSSKEYIKEISENHISGCLKIAPEHFSEKVLKLMNKDNSKFYDFLDFFESINKNTGQSLKYYFMVGHPGDNIDETEFLRNKLMKLRNIESFQMFTPTPMTISSCMYWTGMNPFTMEKIRIVHTYQEKKTLKRMILDCI